MSGPTTVDAVRAESGEVSILGDRERRRSGAASTGKVVGGARRRASLVPVLAGVVAGATASLLLADHLFSLVALVSWGLVFVVAHAPSRRPPRPLRDVLVTDVRLTVTLASLWALLAVVGASSLAGARAGVSTVLVATVAGAALLSLARRPAAPRRVVLVGTREDVEAYAAASEPDRLVVGCYVVDAGAALAVTPSLLVPTTTSAETLVELADSVRADEVLALPSSQVTAEVVRDLGWRFEDTPVAVGVVCPVAAVSAHRLRTRVSGRGTVLEVGVPRATTAARMVKAALDRVGAVVLLALVAPVLLLLWLGVRFESRGPGLFVQTRVGRDGRPFRMFKLRTMHRDAESMLATLATENECDAVLFKIRRDPRVTRMGYWLRRSSLDELPQLLNVLRGEMSLVGPRPALPEEVAAYDDVARRRLVVKPGITGLWQVSGRSDLEWDESLRLDIYYADNWRLLDDLTIAARTVAAVTRARGAY